MAALYRKMFVQGSAKETSARLNDLKKGRSVLDFVNDSARQLLRYLAGEENRYFFENWEVAQLILGAVLTVVLIFGVESRMLAGFSSAMLMARLILVNVLPSPGSALVIMSTRGSPTMVVPDKALSISGRLMRRYCSASCRS